MYSQLVENCIVAGYYLNDEELIRIGSTLSRNPDKEDIQDLFFLSMKHANDIYGSWESIIMDRNASIQNDTPPEIALAVGTVLIISEAYLKKAFTEN